MFLCRRNRKGRCVQSNETSPKWAKSYRRFDFAELIRTRVHPAVQWASLCAVAAEQPCERAWRRRHRHWKCRTRALWRNARKLNKARKLCGDNCREEHFWILLVYQLPNRAYLSDPKAQKTFEAQILASAQRKNFDFSSTASEHVLVGADMTATLGACERHSIQ